MENYWLRELHQTVLNEFVSLEYQTNAARKAPNIGLKHLKQCKSKNKTYALLENLVSRAEDQDEKGRKLPTSP